jgi:hypothetical protein
MTKEAESIGYGVKGIRFLPKWYVTLDSDIAFSGRCLTRNQAMRKAVKHAILLNKFHRMGW